MCYLFLELYLRFALANGMASEEVEAVTEEQMQSGRWVEMCRSYINAVKGLEVNFCA